MKPWVLLIGTSFSATSLLRALRARGFAVAVCGAVPDDPCIAYADRYHLIDYANPQAVLDVVRAQDYRFICPACNDTAYLSAAWVANKLDLPGFDTPMATHAIHNKARYREIAAGIGLPMPCVWSRFDVLSAADFPLLVKPVDCFSGRGMTRVTDMAALPAAIDFARAASRTAEVVVEAFREGTLHSHSAFLQNGQIACDYFVDEFCGTYPYQVDCSNHPSCLPIAAREQMRDCICRLAATLSLCDGLIHTQFLWFEDKVCLIESMRRCPGDLYYHLVEFSQGQGYVDAYIAPFIAQQDRCDQKKENIALPWVRHTISFSSDRIVMSIACAIPAALETRYFPLAESGSLIRHAPFGKWGILFVRLADTKSMQGIVTHVSSYLNVSSTEYGHDQADRHENQT